MTVRAKFKVDSITRTKQYDGQEAQGDCTLNHYPNSTFSR